MECTPTAFPYVQILKTIHFYGYLCRRFIFSEQMHEFTGGRVLLIPGINIYGYTLKNMCTEQENKASC